MFFVNKATLKIGIYSVFTVNVAMAPQEGKYTGNIVWAIRVYVGVGVDFFLEQNVQKGSN